MGETTCACPRVKPRSVGDLDFIRNQETATVHVLRWHDESAPHQAGAGQMFLLPGVKTLCGQTFDAISTLAETGRSAYVSHFDDDDLCAACHRSLGDQSYRAFEHSGEVAARGRDGEGH